jgi:hypothetical protein
VSGSSPPGTSAAPVKLLTGYGYRLHSYDQWNLLVDLLNMMPGDRQVYVQVTYTYRSAQSDTNAAA